jgi:CDP-diglyceride synthetase
MKKVIRDFVITFLAVAVISAALYFWKSIDLTQWYYQILIMIIIIGVPYYFNYKRTKK